MLIYTFIDVLVFHENYRTEQWKGTLKKVNIMDAINSEIIMLWVLKFVIVGIYIKFTIILMDEILAKYIPQILQVLIFFIGIVAPTLIGMICLFDTTKSFESLINPPYSFNILFGLIWIARSILSSIVVGIYKGKCTMYNTDC